VVQPGFKKGSTVFSSAREFCVPFCWVQKRKRILLSFHDCPLHLCSCDNVHCCWIFTVQYFASFKVLLEYCYSWFLLRFSRPEQKNVDLVLSVLVQNKLKNLKKLVWCVKKKTSMLTVGSFSNPYWQEVAPFQITPWQDGAEGNRSFNLRIMQNMSYRWHWQWWWSDCIYHPIHTSLRLEPQPEKETCKPKGKCPAVLGYFLLILWGVIPEEDFDDNYLWLVY